MATTKTAKSNRQKPGRFKPCARVFRFQSSDSQGTGERFPSAAKTGDSAKDQAVNVLWKHLSKLSTERLAAVLPPIVRGATDIAAGHEIYLDSDDAIRDTILEGAWKHLCCWRVDASISLIPVVVEFGFLDSGEMVRVQPVAHDVNRW